MNFKTVAFRAALSLALGWLLVVSFLTYQHYEGGLPPAFAASEERDSCGDEQPDFTSKDMIGTKSPTSNDIAICEDVRARVEQRDRERQTKDVFEESSGYFVLWGILPIGLILLLAASKEAIGRMVRRYFAWLKHG